jgi:methylated-DNA-protein-cysteine methyltransferase-like protein
MPYQEYEEIFYEIVKEIPCGKVASYGMIAKMAGYPRHARAVGRALHQNPCQDEIPCHRVVFGDGRLSPAFAFGGEGVQKSMLEQEGVKFVNNRVTRECFISIKGY